MIDILRIPDRTEIISENAKNDAKVTFELKDGRLGVYLYADNEHPCFVRLRWNHRTDKPVKILGDIWERSYGNLEWRSMNEDRALPWYFLANDGKDTVGCGVMVHPNSFVSFLYDPMGVTAYIDVRCGAVGVELSGRTLHCCDIVCEKYEGISTFEAAKKFCHAMCPSPILPKKPVYGGNNWYYAYGKSSRQEILADVELLSSLCEGNSNRPYFVIDDCWQINPCAGPWVANEKFGDTKTLADEIRKRDVNPGIWVRLLHDIDFEEAHPEWCIPKRGERGIYLDPSRKEVMDYVREVVRRIKDWGYEILKHDFSTVDMFGSYDFQLNGFITEFDGWSFFDKSRTGAEIMLDLYRVIKEEAGDMMILGCNTASHLCAGLCEINRTGDDTSGKDWNRTRATGVNTLAFRMAQNGAFYVIDADCVGILDDNIPWELNGRWLDLLAKSGTPLFVSAKPESLTEEMKVALKEAFARSSVQTDVAQPLDWEYNKTPVVWSINGEVVEYDWFTEELPKCLKHCHQN